MARPCTPARDIAAAIYRKKTYDFDKCIYVTSAGQSLHFAQWFKVVELMGYDWAKQLIHVPYGTVSLNGSKLATRTGNVILLRDLFSEAIEKVKEIMDEKHTSLENRDEVAEAVGVGRDRILLSVEQPHQGHQLCPRGRAELRRQHPDRTRSTPTRAPAR